MARSWSFPRQNCARRRSAGWRRKSRQKRQKEGRGDLSDINSFQALKTVRFYFLWIMLFINVTCGIAIISVASPMAQEIAGLTPAAAAAMVGFMGLFNGIGAAWVGLLSSDIIGRPLTYTAFFVIQIIAFLALPSITHAIAFQLVIFLIMTCYGGGFASIPAYIGDLFGTRSLASIHGNVLTAWAAAGLAGPPCCGTRARNHR